MKLFLLGGQTGKAREEILKAKERAREIAHRYVSTVQVHISSRTAQRPSCQWIRDLVSGVVNLYIHLGNVQKGTRAPTLSSSRVKASYLLTGVTKVKLNDAMTVTAAEEGGSSGASTDTVIAAAAASCVVAFLLGAVVATKCRSRKPSGPGPSRSSSSRGGQQEMIPIPVATAVVHQGVEGALALPTAQPLAQKAEQGAASAASAASGGGSSGHGPYR